MPWNAGRKLENKIHLTRLFSTSYRVFVKNPCLALSNKSITGEKMGEKRERYMYI
jgi:hypothetical protein